MAEKSEISKITLMASVVAGAAIGAGIAALYTPKNGNEMRAKISELSGEACGKIKECTKMVQEKINSVVEESKTALTDKKSLLSSVIEAGREALQKGKEAA
jgi:gas vesicle protein